MEASFHTFMSVSVMFSPRQFPNIQPFRPICSGGILVPELLFPEHCALNHYPGLGLPQSEHCSSLNTALAGHLRPEPFRLPYTKSVCVCSCVCVCMSILAIITLWRQRCVNVMGTSDRAGIKESSPLRILNEYRNDCEGACVVFSTVP